MNSDPKRVLIVEDDDELRRFLLALLRDRGLTVDAAENGRTALDLLRETQYSVVLLDLVLPDIEGFAVLDAVEAKNNGTVVLVVTGAERSVVERLDPRRVHGIVRKPFDADEIANVVAACADLRGRSAFETMAIATMLAGAPFLALLHRW